MFMNLLLALFLRPFVAVVILVLAALVASLVWRWLPEGRIKRMLFSPLPGHRRQGNRWR